MEAKLLYERDNLQQIGNELCQGTKSSIKGIKYSKCGETHKRTWTKYSIKRTDRSEYEMKPSRNGVKCIIKRTAVENNRTKSDRKRTDSIMKTAASDCIYVVLSVPLSRLVASLQAA